MDGHIQGLYSITMYADPIPAKKDIFSLPRSCSRYSIQSASASGPYLSFSKTVYRVPTWGVTSTAYSSPSWRYSCGFLPNPTPAGVPERITVPGSNVVP